MKRIVLLLGMLSVGYLASENLPMSPNTSEGKSVYIPISPSVDVVEEGCVQKEDQNASGYTRAQQ
jgi:hypothetical protein